MRRDAIKPLYSSFLSCQKDTETILKKLFVEDRQHAEELKRLLVVNTKDCLDKSNQEYEKAIKDYSVKKLVEENYINLQPTLKLYEHEKIKSYVFISFDNFIPSENNQFRDCTINFDILCHSDCWHIGSYAQRPFMIAGYIDGMLNEQRLSGIGTLKFLSCNELVLDENLSGYTLTYLATHGTDDILGPNQVLSDLLVPVNSLEDK